MTHTCHWPGCPKAVPPAMWGCREHWFRLPKPLRDRIWATYRPGQEIDKDPSDDYLDVADEVQRWIAEAEAAAVRQPSTPEEWQAAVDAAKGVLALNRLALESALARQYGLITDGPTVQISRCMEILAQGETRGIRPRKAAEASGEQRLSL